ncbi:hypothetical protein ACHQM5_018162 [Ranunculus cassubicifolius]
MAGKVFFTDEEMAVDDCLGYPKAYAKLCRDPHLNPYSHGPPFTFTPFALPNQELSRSRDLDQLFPIIDLEAKPTTKPKIFLSLLWKQLNHLGNAGFDPAKFRVDPYGNVVYYYADSASPLAWDIDHWFPCSRGGRTAPCNLRIVQLQVCKRKYNKLEFLVPWWDLQLGVSVNLFLSIFASSNSDFRNRAFSLLFSDGENEELNDRQSIDSHVFPQHFIEIQKEVGLAPAAIVVSQRKSSDTLSVLRSVDLNRKSRSRAHLSEKDGKNFVFDDNESLCKSIQMFRPSMSKENENPETGTSPYLTLAMARDSLRKREEVQAEIRKLDTELDELNKKNEEERVALQDLESVLIKRRRRAEKSRRLAEAQASYKALLEKMIRDAMHQSVVYKEQLRLNQAATSALMARLEAQRAICDSSERDLRRKLKEKDEIEEQSRPHLEQGRKRSRMDNIEHERESNKALIYLPGTKPRKHLQKELRVFLEEEHKLSEELVKERTPALGNLENLDIGEFMKRMKKTIDSPPQSPEKEDEVCRTQRGKGNVEKWLDILLNDSKQTSPVESPHHNTNDGEETSKTEEIIEKLNLKNPQKEIRVLKFPVSEEKVGFNQHCPEVKGSTSVEKGVGSCQSFQGNDRKEKGVARSESARTFRPSPYSPSVILGMKKGVDCIGKKPAVIGSDEETDVVANNIFRSSIKTIRRAVKL